MSRHFAHYFDKQGKNFELRQVSCWTMDIFFGRSILLIHLAILHQYPWSTPRSGRSLCCVRAQLLVQKRPALKCRKATQTNFEKSSFAWKASLVFLRHRTRKNLATHPAVNLC